MKIYLARSLLILASVSLLSACSVAKLEARLEANPQCKDVINPKTGALLPCPGSDKAFYREAGLAPVKPVASANIQTTSSPVTAFASPSMQASSSTTSSAAAPVKIASPQSDCKPQIHKKTGGTLPCPAPD
jgi:hypothetical protein